MRPGQLGRPRAGRRCPMNMPERPGQMRLIKIAGLIRGVQDSTNALIFKQLAFAGWQRVRFEERNSGVEGEILWRSLLLVFRHTI